MLKYGIEFRGPERIFTGDNIGFRNEKCFRKISLAEPGGCKTENYYPLFMVNDRKIKGFLSGKPKISGVMIKNY